MTGVWPGRRYGGVAVGERAPEGELSGATGALTHALSRLSTAESLADVTAAVGHAVRRLMRADGATFVLREDDSCFYVDEDAVAALWKGSRFPMEDCISGWAMLHREVVIVPDIRVDSRIPQDAYRATFVRSLCMAPIGAGEPVGALGAYWRDEHTPSPSEVRLLSVLANSAAVALENLELRAAVDRRSAERDVLSARRDELELAVHSLAHDLRSPLGAVLGYAELLEDELADDADAVRQVGQTIRMAGQRMAGQIDQMLALYRVTSGSVLPTTVDLTAMARSIIEDLVGVEEQREIVTEVAEGLVVRADAELTHLMLHNLLNNALKFTRHRPVTRIEVGSGGAPGEGNPLPRGLADAGLGVFFVRDNGVGFEPDDARRLFQPLVRLHSDAGFPGTGLGLASVARVVEVQGGQVAACSRPDEGATFFFSLPTGADPADPGETGLETRSA